jgi:hypothetical protein
VISRADFIGEYMSKSAPKIKELIASYCGSVCVIEEAYSLCYDSIDTYDKETVDTLIGEMITKIKQVGFVMNSYKEELDKTICVVNDGFMHRITFIFNINDYIL